MLAPQLTDGGRSSGSRSAIVLGLCAMAKKAKSKPMKAILTRLHKLSHIRIVVFEERDILEEPIESWPKVDALISFYSHGFPLEKVVEYAELRRPFLINDLLSQRLLMDRQKVYERLRELDIPVVRHAVCHRDASAEEATMGGCSDSDFLIEAEDHIVLHGVTFNKPFVEKPLDADDHNIRIYFPSAAGGGSVSLFRKVGNCSSVYYQQQSRVRRRGSFVYEDFMVTDGTDIKVYAIGGDYAHAEARKSPALDGKVERDPEGKEMRCPVILTAREKIIAKKVVEAFSQTVCGFDLLRANGISYVCDVNGFSFVKSSNKYYDDCAYILAALLTQAIAPSLSLSLSCPSMDQPPLVRTTFGTVMELRCLIAVIRHGDRTPKQKLKTPVFHTNFYRLFNQHRGVGCCRWFEAKLKKPAALQELLNAARDILLHGGVGGGDVVDGPPPSEDRASMEQVRQVLEMHGRFRGINRKAQLKFYPAAGMDAAMAGSEVDPAHGQLLLVLKWGGALTDLGRSQAEKLGRAFRVIYPGGESCSRSDGLGLLRLHSTYRHDLKIYASDEGRVQTTAAAFAKGFLDLEGPLTPILVQMVKSANTNGLLDSDNDSRQYMSAVKSRIQANMSVDRDFTEADVQRIAPDGAAALIRAMCNLANPKAACRNMLDGIAALIGRLEAMRSEHQENELSQLPLLLYHGESVDLALGRWQKLIKEFYNPVDDQFQLAKVPDIYDNIKYDLLHNEAIFDTCGATARQLYCFAKSMADIVVPSEYGISGREKLLIAQHICNPLLKKLLADMQYTNAIEVDESEPAGRQDTVGFQSPSHVEDTQVNRGIRSLNATQPQERFVRTRLYFTSESHLHSVINVLRHGDLANQATDEQWARAIDYCNAVTELNYLTQIVFMIYEDSQQSADSDNRYHVELHFSPGCVAATPSSVDFSTAASAAANGGYRPRRHGNSVCGAGIRGDNTAAELCASVDLSAKSAGDETDALASLVQQQQQKTLEQEQKLENETEQKKEPVNAQAPEQVLKHEHSQELEPETKVEQLHRQKQEPETKVEQLHRQKQEPETKMEQLHRQEQEPETKMEQLHRQEQEPETKMEQLHRQEQEPETKMEQLHRQEQEPETKMEQLHRQEQEPETKMEQLHRQKQEPETKVEQLHRQEQEPVSQPLTAQPPKSSKFRVGRFELSSTKKLALCDSGVDTMSDCESRDIFDGANRDSMAVQARQRQNSWSHRFLEFPDVQSSQQQAQKQQQQQQQPFQPLRTCSEASNEDTSAAAAAGCSASTFHASADVKRMLRHISSKSLVLPAADSKQNLISTSLIRSSDPEFHSSSLHCSTIGHVGETPAVAASAHETAPQGDTAMAAPIADAAAAAADSVGTEATEEAAKARQQCQLVNAPCVPGIYPLETLHNSLTLRQVELFLHRFTRVRQRTPGGSRQASCAHLASD